MKAMPFTISSKARALIEETVRIAEAGNNEIAGMIPSLFYSLKQQTRDKNGKIIELISVDTFGVGWYNLKSAKDFVSVDFFGRKLAIHPLVLKKLRRKRLVLRTVNCGYPDRASKRRKLLRAISSTH